MCFWGETCVPKREAAAACRSQSARAYHCLRQLNLATMTLDPPLDGKGLPNAEISPEQSFDSCALAALFTRWELDRTTAFCSPLLQAAPVLTLLL